MKSAHHDFEQEFKLLRDLTSSDFLAVALHEQDGNRIRWVYGSGNMNERYKEIAEKPGRGLAGQAVRSGRPVIVDGEKSDSERSRREYPIMLAERLFSAIVAPITVGTVTCGALLAGSRSSRSYNDEDIRALQRTANRIAEALGREE